MDNTTAELGHSAPNAPASFPALQRLRLSMGDLELLRRQGSVVADRRRGCVYFKLVFRRDGVQIARYVGDEHAAAIVKAELELLRAGRRDWLQFKRLGRVARGLLRNSKRQLGPLLEDRGFHFHGLEIRRTRWFRDLLNPNDLGENYEARTNRFRS